MADTSKATGEKFDLTVEKKEDDEAVSRLENDGAPAPSPRPAPKPALTPRDEPKPEAKPEEVPDEPKADDPEVDPTAGAGVEQVTDEERAARDERLHRADDGARLEQRPLTHPGLTSAQRNTDVDYSVEQELREQWPTQFEEGE